MRKFTRAIKIIIFNVVLATLLLIGIEAAWLKVLDNPSLMRSLPRGVQLNIQSQYMTNDRKIIQYLPECAVYNPEFTYTLRPGSCLFENKEFSVEVHANSIGVRDDEGSLEAPEVVVLGDSLAMGWGVCQDCTFAQLIEKSTGRKVLNASVSSYGTAREILQLKKIDTSAMKYLVIQYTDNDFRENIQFHTDGPLPESKYMAKVDEHARDYKYVFGSHVARFVKGVFSRRDQNAPEASTGATQGSGSRIEADTFLRMLMRSPKDISGVRLIVLEISPFNLNDSGFAKALQEMKSSPLLPGFFANMQVLDMSVILDSDDYFIIDDHLNERGHEKTASAIMSAM
jgi:hypothetical protein